MTISRLWSWRTSRFRPRNSVPASTRYGAATTSHIHQSDCPSASQPAWFATSASAIRTAAAASAKGGGRHRYEPHAPLRAGEPSRAAVRREVWRRSLPDQNASSIGRVQQRPGRHMRPLWPRPVPPRRPRPGAEQRLRTAREPFTLIGYKRYAVPDGYELLRVGLDLHALPPPVSHISA
jgi:hypothetical protein